MIPPPSQDASHHLDFHKIFYMFSWGSLYKHYSLPLLGEVLASQVLLVSGKSRWLLQPTLGGQKYMRYLGFNPHMEKKHIGSKIRIFPEVFGSHNAPKNILFLRQRFKNHLQGGPLAVINGVTE